MMDMNKPELYCGDCLDLLSRLPPSSVDFICTDMPYGVTRAEWDSKIDLAQLWSELTRVAKPKAVFAMFAAGKFAYRLAQSNFKNFRYRYVWDKCDDVTGFLNASRRPLVGSEDILIFSAGQGTYNPQRRDPIGGGGRMYTQKSCLKTDGRFYGTAPRVASSSTDGKRFPCDILRFKPQPRTKRINSTQKPVPLLVYLIKTYTNEGQTVLDPFMGSGSCGVACKDTGRKFIGIEKDPTFFAAAQQWITES